MKQCNFGAFICMLVWEVKSKPEVDWKQVAEMMRKRQRVFEQQANPKCTYEIVLYLAFFTISILAIIERFTYNFMPDVTFKLFKIQFHHKVNYYFKFVVYLKTFLFF